MWKHLFINYFDQDSSHKKMNKNNCSPQGFFSLIIEGSLWMSPVTHFAIWNCNDFFKLTANGVFIRCQPLSALNVSFNSYIPCGRIPSVEKRNLRPKEIK